MRTKDILFRTICLWFAIGVVLILGMTFTGCSDSDGDNVDNNIAADFSASFTEINEGETITFDDLSTGNPMSWSWTFEGGSPSSSTDQNPTVTYDTGGSYAVTLVVTGAQGSSDSMVMTDYITVTATSGVFSGYMLLAPIQSRTIQLIDTDKSIAHTWTSSHAITYSNYLLEDGTLLRTALVDNGNRFSDTGGASGMVEKLDWDSNVTWNFEYATDESCLHHDVAELPNGNILMTAWVYKRSADAEDAGRNPSLLPDGEVWPEKIIEVDPQTNDIVWQWHAWDHLIQDYDPAKANYGTVSDHPERIDINYVGDTAGVEDWLHFNAIDYNEALDQIIVSSHEFDEFWVLDHSTTTEEAASHSGGRYGKGGDILYRWGNPATYRASGNHVFYGQHNVQWIPSGTPGAGDILVFNNGWGRPEGAYSTVEEIVPDVNPDGSYSVTTGQAFGPSSQKWIYMAPTPTDFYGVAISGAQRLRNGNTFICEGPDGYIFEVTYDGSVVWTFQNTDGMDSAAVFRALKYPYDYSGLGELYK